MAEILANSLIPVFAGLLVGYLAGIRKVVDNKDLRTLITFVMSFAVPCALFITIVRAPHELLAGEGRVVLVLAVIYLVTYAVTYFLARKLARLNGADSAVLSLTLSFPNAAAIGIPLLPAVYGVPASLTDVVAIAVGAVTISPITLAILENNSGSHDHLTGLSRIRASLWKAVQRPVVWAPMLGVLFVTTGLTVPTYADKSLSVFATATAGAALFLTGLVVSAQRFTLKWSVAWSVAGKTLLQPALCLGAARAAGLPLDQTRHVVLVAAIPCGFFGVVFGKSFGATPDVASSTLIASTVAGVLTLAGWIVLSSWV
jgi:malonate transporter